MDPEQFDSLLIQSAMARAETRGWRRVTIVEAARDAGLPLDEARARFPMRHLVLLRLGMLADRAALVDDGSVGTVRERLFDLLMRRIDVLQQYRGGVRAVLQAVPLDPGLALMLGAATEDSLRWIAEAAGVDTSGLAGRLRVAGLAVVWLQTVRAWDRDDSADLSGTMATLDKALDRADRLGQMLLRPLFSRGKPEDDVAIDDAPLPDPGPVDPLT